MHQRPATIKEIAAHLGISHTTVSRALNDHRQISAETKRLVRAAAETLGYVVNSSARLMRHHQNALIGLVIPDIRNDFYSTIARILAERCRAAGFQMVLANTQDDPIAERDQVQALIEARAAGIVITPSVTPLEKTGTLLRSVTTVQLVRRSAALPGDTIGMDDVAAMRAATAHLLGLGHRRIGYVGTRQDISAGEARLRGFLAAHAAVDLAPDKKAMILVQPWQSFGAEGVARLLSLSRAPTAIVIGSSELTIGGLGAIQAAGLSIPDDISVVGYGDPVWFNLLSPPLTAMRLPVEDMAEATARHLFWRIGAEASASEGGLAPPLLQPRLMLRRSTAAPRRGRVASPH
jgi:LacI family transcriptional regulator